MCENACRMTSTLASALTRGGGGVSSGAGDGDGGGSDGSGSGGGSSGSGGAGALRDATFCLLADALPPSSLFALLAAAEATLMPAESDALRQRSLAGQAARSLRAVVTNLATEVAAADGMDRGGQRRQQRR